MTKIFLVLALAPLFMGTPAQAQGMGMGNAGADMATRPLSAPELPTGTVSVRIGRGSLSNNAVGLEVTANVMAADGKVQKLTTKTGPDGRALFKDLPVGAHFQAQVTVDGQALKTADFPVPSEGGTRLILVSAGTGAEAAPDEQAMPPGHEGMMQAMRGDAPHATSKERTGDVSALRMGPGSRLVLDLREDSLVVMEELVLENTSDKIFQPGPNGLMLPVPDGGKDVEIIPGGVPLKAEGSSVAVTGGIPPVTSGMPVRARFGMTIAARNRGEIEIRQPVPMGLPTPLLFVPDNLGLTVQAAGLREMPPQTDDAKSVVHIFELPSVPNGGILRFTVTGMPTRSHTGQAVAGMLFFLVVLGGVFLMARGRSPNAPSADTRGKLLDELAEWERARLAGDKVPEDKRTQLLADLRQSYRQVR
jgi:hypothetical protein